MPTAATKVIRFDQLRQGMHARVLKIEAASAELARLQEMGLTEGTIFRVVKIAPFGDPVELDLRGYRLCLRRKEAQGILVEPVDL